MGCSHGRAVAIADHEVAVLSTYAKGYDFEPELTQSLRPPYGRWEAPRIAWCRDCGAIRLPLLQEFPRSTEPSRCVSPGIWLRPSDPRFDKEFVTANELGVPAAKLRRSESDRREARRESDERRRESATWEAMLGRSDRMVKRVLRARSAIAKGCRWRAQVCGWALTTVCGLTQRAAAKEIGVGVSAGSVGRWTRRLRGLAVAEVGQASYDAYVAAVKRDATVPKAVRTYLGMLNARRGA